MQETAKSARVFRFGVFEVDAATGELRKQGLRIRLQEQPSQLLLMLLERAGEVVGREEICRKLWPPDTFVDFDQSLGTALRKLRQALSDDAETPHYIETIPKHGFRFVAPVERISATNSPPAPETKPEPHMALRVPILWWAAFAATCVLSLFLGWMMYTRQSAGDGQQSMRPTRSSILPPSSWYFEHSSFSVSPDGTRLAFVAFGPEGNDKLWVRALSASNAPTDQWDGRRVAAILVARQPPNWFLRGRQVSHSGPGQRSSAGNLRRPVRARRRDMGPRWHDCVFAFC